MTKNAPRDAHSCEEKICRKRPRETPECAKAHSLFLKMKTNKKPKVPKQLPLPSALCKNKESLSLLSAF